MFNNYLNDLSIGELGRWMKEKSQGADEVQTSSEVWNHIADRLIDQETQVQKLLRILERSEGDGR